jgi:hypothetical protein
MNARRARPRPRPPANGSHGAARRSLGPRAPWSHYRRACRGRRPPSPTDRPAGSPPRATAHRRWSHSPASALQPAPLARARQRRAPRRAVSAPRGRARAVARARVWVGGGAKATAVGACACVRGRAEACAGRGLTLGECGELLHLENLLLAGAL